MPTEISKQHTWRHTFVKPHEIHNYNTRCIPYLLDKKLFYLRIIAHGTYLRNRNWNFYGV